MTTENKNLVSGFFYPFHTDVYDGEEPLYAQIYIYSINPIIKYIMDTASKVQDKISKVINGRPKYKSINDVLNSKNEKITEIKINMKTNNDVYKKVIEFFKNKKYVDALNLIEKQHSDMKRRIFLDKTIFMELVINGYTHSISYIIRNMNKEDKLQLAQVKEISFRLPEDTWE